jgi:nitrous oxide reductase accessory protein NosL
MSTTPAGKPSHANDDDWQLRATESAIAAVRGVISKDGINQRAMIGSLSDIELGWFVAAAIFAYIKTKAQQAVAEGQHYDEPIRTMTYRDMQPWEIGAVEAVLPGLADLPGIDWSKPVGDWSKEDMARFVWRAHRLTDSALAARDNGAAGAVIKFSKEKAERELSASRGGSLMTQDELNDQIPF